MDLEKFKDLVLTKNISQIRHDEIKALIDEYPYFNVLKFFELLSIRQNDGKKFNEMLSSSAIFFSDKKRLYHLLNTDLQSELIDLYGKINTTNIEDSALDEQHSSTEELLDFSDSEALKNNAEKDAETLAQDEVMIGTAIPTEKKISLIDRFLIEDPGPIRADKKTSLIGDVSKASIIESENLLTDTLAKIYVKQGLFNKAIYAYEKLSLKYPEKSVYFASQIKEIKETINKK